MTTERTEKAGAAMIAYLAQPRTGSIGEHTIAMMDHAALVMRASVLDLIEVRRAAHFNRDWSKSSGGAVSAVLTQLAEDIEGLSTPGNVMRAMVERAMQ